MTTYYCPRGCNVFSTEAQYEDHDGPECGSCGQIMTTDSEPLDDAHEQREIAGIAECERRLQPQILKDATGFFIAAEFAGTGMVRVSLEYWKTFEQARKALIRSNWTARDLDSSDWTYAK